MNATDLTNRRLYLCTPDRPDLASFLEAVLSGGVDIVQLRDKHADASRIIARANVAKEVCAAFDVPFILNDRPDLALDVGADGVHVGQDDAPVSLCRRLLGPDAIIGLSTHESAEFDASLAQDATYISAGPIEATPTKPGRSGTGVEYAAQATAVSSRPVFVTGGVTPGRIGELAAAGVERFVVVRALCDAPDPRAVAVALRRAIDEAFAS